MYVMYVQFISMDKYTKTLTIWFIVI